VKLGVDAPEVVAPADIGALDLGATHGQRISVGPNSTEARGSGFGFLQELEIDLDREDPLHAPDVRPADLLERVEEGARPGKTRRRVDDLVAMDAAAAALDLVLWAKWEAPRTSRLL